jgi:hypothetical protein
MPEKREKCSKAGWCDDLGEVLEDRTKKGLSVLETTKMDTGQTRVAGVQYKTKSSSPFVIGKIVNFCPFCAQDINWLTDTADYDKAAAVG